MADLYVCSHGKAGKCDTCVRLYGPKPLTIEWESLSPDSFSPEFTGYTAAPYCTGNPELGWCLYSRGAGACWNQRTKEQIAPRSGLAPQQIGGKWYWVEYKIAVA